MRRLGNNAKPKHEEWYTPPYIIEAARRAMGGIDLDPASCHTAQAIVQAGTYYTKEQNGLRQPWFGRVWLNPPFRADNVRAFSMALALRYYEHKTDCGILLVNATTDGAWFHWLLERFPALIICRRVKFIMRDGGIEDNSCGQVLFNVGVNECNFLREFGGTGTYVKAVK